MRKKDQHTGEAAWRAEGSAFRVAESEGQRVSMGKAATGR